METAVTGVKEKPSDYPALACPLCDQVRKPVRVNEDGSVSYSCAPDHKNHGSKYTWRIAKDGTFIEYGHAH